MITRSKSLSLISKPLFFVLLYYHTAWVFFVPILCMDRPTMYWRFKDASHLKRWYMYFKKALFCLSFTWHQYHAPAIQAESVTITTQHECVCVYRIHINMTSVMSLQLSLCLPFTRDSANGKQPFILKVSFLLWFTTLICNKALYICLFVIKMHSVWLGKSWEYSFTNQVQAHVQITWACF